MLLAHGEESVVVPTMVLLLTQVHFLSIYSYRINSCKILCTYGINNKRISSSSSNNYLLFIYTNYVTFNYNT